MQPISSGQTLLGYVELSGSIDYGQQTLATARRAFILAGIGATLLALVVGLWVSRSLSAPLTSLAAAAGQMSAGDLSVRAPVQGSDEIGQLGRQFNQMAARLERSFAELAAERDSLRRFIADASHELRTPDHRAAQLQRAAAGAGRRGHERGAPSSWPRARARSSVWSGSPPTCSTCRGWRAG